MERILTPWTGAAFNDITWTELHSGRGSSGFNREYFRKHYPSLGKPDTYWLEYYSESSGLVGKRVQSTLKSTQDVVTVDTSYNAIGNIKSRVVRVNNGPALRFENRNFDWLLLDEKGDVLARFERGATTEKFPLEEADLAYLGGPDDPHVYEKVFVKGEALAEMIVPNSGVSFARFKHQPLVPYMRGAPENLTKEQTEILLAMLLLPITQ
ncbi:MAG: hypothetical protein IPG44_17685 [Anaerolineales bacterium]|nr:hypothetical protein [Chloroflexota bacterium]MBK6647547.1 hypothetical protein [Anaerolineales bacterium]MCC6986803.1 hypothetical protein [Anaerolineales bacterium]